MKISNSDYDYLNGQKYSNGRKIKFQFDNNDKLYFTRSDFLKELVVEKEVIHVGFIDHDIDTIKNKISKGKWLHSVLDDSAKRCFGIDILDEEINFVRNNLGFTDVSVGDITSTIPDEISGLKWDYLMIPEVLEHIDNPVIFLEGIKRVWKGSVRKMVITVPNAFTPNNFRSAKQRFEHINTDHRYWFTPYTAAKIVCQAGLKVDRIVMCHHGRIKKRSFIRNYKFKKNPLTRSDIILLIDF